MIDRSKVWFQVGWSILALKCDDFLEFGSFETQDESEVPTLVEQAKIKAIKQWKVWEKSFNPRSAKGVKAGVWLARHENDVRVDYRPGDNFSSSEQNLAGWTLDIVNGEPTWKEDQWWKKHQ